MRRITRTDFIHTLIQTRPGYDPVVAALTGVIILVVFLLSGCQTRSTISTTRETVWTPTVPGRLAPGDVVRLTYPGAPEFNQTQRVRADGRLTLPVVGEITADGKRPGDLQTELAGRYQGQLQDSEVMVSLEASASPVYVSGAVRTPGRILIDRPMTALEAIMEAGGFDPDYADPSKVTLLRNEKGKHHSLVLDLRPALKGKEIDAFYLRPYDVIYVPRSLF